MFSTHIQSAHCATQVEAQHLEPNEKFINVSCSMRNEKNRSKFIQALQDIKMDSTQEDAAEIFAAFDTEGKRYIDMTEFLFQLRVLSLAREALVSRCFKKLDKDNDDVITVSELRRSYSVKHHQLYVNGDEEKETIMKRFLATFEEGDNLSAKVQLQIEE